MEILLIMATVLFVIVVAMSMLAVACILLPGRRRRMTGLPAGREHYVSGIRRLLRSPGTKAPREQRATVDDKKR
ncbi:hypothetical protein P9239_21270 [Caballeronia sp. LZ062]|uniref:hypothetical protein n=1 Tax=unclassified Caballeronia TaxID=2646786 RepID=UPI00285F5256|nr:MULTISPECIES: hypothetical protein [unclassified Caballeronia]MDR5856209.1 hypothetical protein [Caballeronia sp. LZ050]MDR5872880.1 hypothetical protein [Caballeronia sp. LZ062]